MFHVKHRETKLFTKTHIFHKILFMEQSYSKDIQDKFMLYIQEIQKWQKAVQLISSKDLSKIYSRHILNCAQIAPYILSGKTVVDLGSGAGFPGIVLSILRNIPVTLIECDQRKSAFLQHISRILELPTNVVNQRIEMFQNNHFIEKNQILTARALAPLETLISYALPWLKAGGECFFLKGKNYQEELNKCKKFNLFFKVIPLNNTFLIYICL